MRIKFPFYQSEASQQGKHEGPRTRVGQRKMKYWKLYKNEVKMCIPYEHINFEQLLKHILRVFPSLGG